MASPSDPGRPPVTSVDREVELPLALAATGLPSGRPVVVLIGGAAGIEASASEALLPVVRDGVLGPASEAGAIVIDGGTDAGVMALAGRARHELGAPVALLGVAPRSKVAAPGVSDSKGSTPLEPNHSHVLLVPGNEWGSESAWLVRAAKILSAGKPVVAVLVDGGPVALSEAMECAAQGWPVVTVQGTGRSADMLAGYSRGSTEPSLGPTGRAGIHVVELSAGVPALRAKLHELIEPAASHEVAPPAERPDALDYPALYLAASEAAKRGQTIHRRLSLAEITLTTIGLVIVLATRWLRPMLGLPEEILTNVTVGVSALSFLTALVLKLISRSSGFDADWYNGRALAETVKSLAWRYMMRASPYAPADADRRFTADLAQVLRRRPDFRQATDRLPERPRQISAHMRSVRGLALNQRRDYYVQHRLLDQADWYRRKSAAGNRSGARWFWLSVLFQLGAAATAVAALAGAGDAVLGVIALFGSVALAVAAWSQLNRYDELARSYAVAFQELALIAAVAEDAGDEAALDALVRDGEEAIGREHRLWIAKRTEAIEAPEAVDEGDE